MRLNYGYEAIKKDRCITSLSPSLSNPPSQKKKTKEKKGYFLRVYVPE